MIFQQDSYIIVLGHRLNHETGFKHYLEKNALLRLTCKPIRVVILTEVYLGKHNQAEISASPLDVGGRQEGFAESEDDDT